MGGWCFCRRRGLGTVRGRSGSIEITELGRVFEGRVSSDQGDGRLSVAATRRFGRCGEPQEEMDHPLGVGHLCPTHEIVVHALSWNAQYTTEVRLRSVFAHEGRHLGDHCVPQWRIGTGSPDGTRTTTAGGPANRHLFRFGPSQFGQEVQERSDPLQVHGHKIMRITHVNRHRARVRSVTY